MGTATTFCSSSPSKVTSKVLCSTFSPEEADTLTVTALPPGVWL